MNFKHLLPIAAIACSINTQAQNWTPDTISMGVGYTNDAFYSFQNGSVDTVNNTNWTLAFETLNPMADPHGGVGIWTNEASKGEKVLLYSLNKQGTTSFLTLSAADTVGKISDELALHNSDTTYANGAFNTTTGTNGMFDYGWGMYIGNETVDGFPAHSVVGDSLYLLITATGGGMGQPATQTGAYIVWPRAVVGATDWTVYIRALGDTNIDTLTFSNANATGIFKYYNISSNQIFDREPAKNTWDINFTNYMSNYGGIETGGVISKQGVTGVLSNYKTTVAKVSNLIPNDADYTSLDSNSYSKNINTIGYDWKSINMQTYSYDVVDSTSWFVKLSNGDIWQMYFDAIYKDSTNNERKIAIEKRKVFTNTTSIIPISNDVNNIVVAPNPSNNGYTNLLIDAKKEQANTQITITDIAGKVVFRSQKNIPAGLNQFRIDVSGFSSGLYIINLSNSNWHSTQKLIVK